VLRENGLEGICYTKEEFQRRAARADAVTRMFRNLSFCESTTQFDLNYHHLHMPSCDVLPAFTGDAPIKLHVAV
jgi:hypothetical protein